MAASKLLVGNVEVLTIDDIEVDFPIPLEELYPNLPADEWPHIQERYPDVFSNATTQKIHFGANLIRSEGQTILVDTGLGGSASNPGAVAMFAGGTDGRLLAELQSAGVSPEDIDMVFFTHLHPDHVGWNLSRDGEKVTPTFPSARYVCPQEDWEAFQKPEVQAAFPFPFWEETIGPLENLGVVDLISGEKQLTKEVTAIPSPGHTPGHTCLAIVSGGERALLLGDLAVNPALITNPEWVFSFDMDEAVAVESRKRILDRAEGEDATLVVCHYPSPGYGKLVRFEGRRYWQGL